MKKKGVSPVIATSLLVAMVIVIGLIIFLWFRSFVQEPILKFESNVELACKDVQFRATYSSGTISIINDGDVPIYQMNLRTLSGGDYQTEKLSNAEGWPKSGLNIGGTVSITKTVTGDKIILSPVLMGVTESGKTPYDCDEKTYGFEILL